MREESDAVTPRDVTSLVGSLLSPRVHAAPRAQSSPRNKIPQLFLQEQLKTIDSVVRAAVSAQLQEMIVDGGPWREAVRTELTIALKECGSPPPPARQSERPATPPGSSAPAEGADEGCDDLPVGEVSMCLTGDLQAQDLASSAGRASLNRLVSAASNLNLGHGHRVAVGEHLMSFMKVPSQDSLGSGNFFCRSLHLSADSTLSRKVNSWYRWWKSVKEPTRTGRLASVVTSRPFDIVVNIVIFLNILFMIFAASSSIQQPQDRSDPVVIGDWAFQIFFTVEIIMRLVVHRGYFFCNDHRRLNWFDFYLVIGGYVSLIGDNYSLTGSFLRVVRMSRFGKAMRAVRIMAELKHLRSFLVCLQGSMENFFWSVVMLCMVFLVFGLFLMQQITLHLQETGSDLSGDFEALFGSVPAAMLTLYEAATGGDDWKNVYEVLRQAGEVPAAIFLLYIAFVQLALINIITGIFVESAMMTLQPDGETIALEHAQREKEYAQDLERLCINVDHDFSGKLTPEQFEDGMRKGRIPTLLTLLGLNRDQVLEFFNMVSSLAAHDDGQVDIKHFVAGCMRLKGPATNFDLQTLRSHFAFFERTLQTTMETIDIRLQDLQRKSGQAV